MYSNKTKEKAVKLSNQIGVKECSLLLNIPYKTINVWIKKEKQEPGCFGNRQTSLKPNSDADQCGTIEILMDGICICQTSLKITLQVRGS